MAYDVAQVVKRNASSNRYQDKEKSEDENDYETTYFIDPKDHPHSYDKKGDNWSIFVLLVLYILQGVPLGLSASIPLILQNHHVTYSQQALFSFATWPFRY